MIQVIERQQQLIIYKKIDDMTIDEHLKVLNNALAEIVFIYFDECIVSSEIIELQKRIKEIKNKEIQNEINTRANTYKLRINKLQFMLDNIKLEEYIKSLSFIELMLYIYDFKEQNVELTEQGILVAKELNKEIEKRNLKLEQIEITEKKK